MSAQVKLMSLYEDWRAWTQVEGDAILTMDWGRVAQCQSAKKELQSAIARRTQDARDELHLQGGDQQVLDGPLRAVVNELISLEMRNQEYLSGQRVVLEKDRLDIEEGGRRVAKIHKSYTAPASAGWEQYS